MRHSPDVKEEYFLAHSLCFSALLWCVEKESAKRKVRVSFILINRLLQSDRKSDRYSPSETEMAKSGTLLCSGCNR